MIKPPKLWSEYLTLNLHYKKSTFYYTTSVHSQLQATATKKWACDTVVVGFAASNLTILEMQSPWWLRSTIFFYLAGEVFDRTIVINRVWGQMCIWTFLGWQDVFSLFGSVPALCALGVDSQVDIQDVGSVERFGHTLHHYGLGRLSRIWGPFQDHFIMHLRCKQMQTLSEWCYGICACCSLTSFLFTLKKR